MTNYLAVSKSLFGNGVSPLGKLIIAQIAEFERTTGKCFISNEILAKNFDVSVSTIVRELSKLESGGFIIKETKAVVGGGKERVMRVNKDKISSDESNCSFTEKQNESIKDK